MSSESSAITNQIMLTNPPSDGITSVNFFNNSNHLVVTSWDQSVTIHNADISSNSLHTNTELLYRYEHAAGVLDSLISPDDSHIYSSGCDYLLKSFDIESQKDSIIGNHLQPIRCLEYCDINNNIISGSWDKTLKIWDERSSPCEISNINLPGKVYTMSMVKNNYRLVVGMDSRLIYIYDIRNLSEPEQKRESSLKYQTRKIVTHPNGNTYIVSSIEGRVAVEYFDPNPEIQKNKYAFKCHRSIDKATGMQKIYPVNTIAFHPIYKTFATGGADGVLNIWDGQNKKRICQFPSYNTSIADIDFNSNGTLISIAASYTWEQGDQPHAKDTVWIRNVKQSEAKPKPKSKKKVDNN